MLLEEIVVCEEQLDEATLKQILSTALLGGALLLNPAKINQDPIVRNVAVGKIDQVKAVVDQLSATVVSKYKVPKSDAREAVKAALKYGKPTFPTAVDLLATMGVESGFQPSAKSKLKNDPALGVLQVRPAANGITPADLSTIDKQVKVGSEILSKLYKQLGNPEDALHAYNVGLTNFKKGNHNPRYVPKIKHELALYKNPTKKV